MKRSAQNKGSRLSKKVKGLPRGYFFVFKVYLGWIMAVFMIPLPGNSIFTNTPPAQIQQQALEPIPVMAYYYIWYDTGSWERAKTDYPILGRYSSDNRRVMEQHVRWAKDAGIDGFIVSWKSTFLLDRRLQQLMDVAAAEDFQLWIMYQGLDYERKPLPTSWIDADLEYFIENFADHPAFSMYDKPIIIWSGTWEFTMQEIETTIRGYLSRLTILASERNVEGYLRLAELVDGNAYYWSSVNPQTHPGYKAKLDEMSRVIHENGGIWIAPAAPGFDARQIGGERVIERLGGETLRLEMDTAVQSSPDAIGLISWNEFSENTHVEPSENYGSQALDILADIQSGIPPTITDFDSSAPATTDQSDFYSIFILAGLFAFIVISIVITVKNRSQHQYTG